MVVLSRGQLRQLPLVTVVVVVIEPVVHVAFGIIKRFPTSHFVSQFILHVAVKALLWGVVPAVAPARHALPKAEVVDQPYELDAGIVATLIGVNHRLRLQGNTVISLHDFDCLQHKVNLKAVAEHMGQCLFRVGVQDRGQVEEAIVKPHRIVDR